MQIKVHTWLNAHTVYSGLICAYCALGTEQPSVSMLVQVWSWLQPAPGELYGCDSSREASSHVGSHSFQPQYMRVPSSATRSMCNGVAAEPVASQWGLLKTSASSIFFWPLLGAVCGVAWVYIGLDAQETEQDMWLEDVCQGNFILVTVRKKLQSRWSNLIPSVLSQIAKKFSSYGWAVQRPFCLSSCKLSSYPRHWSPIHVNRWHVSFTD